jgi:adenylate cyclase, class 2
MKEFEIQVRVENLAPLLAELEKNGEFKGEKRQIDEYFSPAHRDFTAVRPVAEWLRLRESGGKATINYKFWNRDEKGRSTYADEQETAVGDIAVLRKIFEILNFRKICTVDKVRKAWQYKQYEIAVDSVQGLGDFVEVEQLTEEDLPAEKVNGEMIVFLKQIGCGKLERNQLGYPFMLLFKDEIKTEVL